MRRFVAGCALAVLCASSLCRAEEWPKWLGPRGDGISKEAALADKWPEGGPRKLWSKEVGYGYSSPIAVGGKIYLFAQQGTKDTLYALDGSDGKVVWSQSYDCTHPADAGQAKNPESPMPVPNATPTIDGNRIYTYGGGGDLVCREVADGKQVWKLNVLDQTQSKILTWNQSSSPLVTDKLVYVQGGKGIVAVAVEKESGKIAWKSQKGLGGYAAIIQADVGGTPQLVVFGGDMIFGMDPQHGKTLWTVPWKTSYDVNAATPLYTDGKVFITSDYPTGHCALFTLSNSGAQKDWDNKNITSKYQPVILDNGYLYANSEGKLKCVNWADGSEKWKDDSLKLGSGGSLVRAGDKLIVMSERGKLSLVKATPDGMEKISQIALFDYNQVWATPLIYQGKLFAKGEKELVCLDISNGQARGPNLSNPALAQAHP